MRATMTYGDVAKIDIACATLSPMPPTKDTVWYIALRKYGIDRLNTNK